MGKFSWSFWESRLQADPVDLLVIGAGFTGLMTAWKVYQKAGPVRIRVVDQLPFGAAASTRNAGFACFGSITELEADAGKRPESEVVELVARRVEGLRHLLSDVPLEAMDYRKSGGYEWMGKEDGNPAKLMEKWNHLLHPLFGTNVFYPAEPPSSKWQYAVYCPEEGQLDPARLWRYLSRRNVELGIELYPACKVTGVEGTAEEMYQVEFENGMRMQAKKVLFALNGYLSHLHPELQVRPARNNVLVSKPIRGLNLIGNYHVDRGFIYFRQVDDRLLIGGGRHWDEEKELTDRLSTSSNICERLIDFAKMKIPGARAFEPAFEWSGIIGLGDSKEPVCREMPDGTFAAGGLGGMGVALSSLLAGRCASMIVESLKGHKRYPA